MAAKVSAPLSAHRDRTAATTVAPATDDASVLPQSGYLTAEWVKRRYSISNSTLYKWIADKRFVAPVRIGPRAVRWRSAPGAGSRYRAR